MSLITDKRLPRVQKMCQIAPSLSAIVETYLEVISDDTAEKRNGVQSFQNMSDEET
jgi:hypothetical protein